MNPLNVDILMFNMFNSESFIHEAHESCKLFWPFERIKNNCAIYYTCPNYHSYHCLYKLHTFEKYIFQTRLPGYVCIYRPAVCLCQDFTIILIILYAIYWVCALENQPKLHFAFKVVVFSRRLVGVSYYHDYHA